MSKLTKTVTVLIPGVVDDDGPRFEIQNEGFNWVYVGCGGVNGTGMPMAQMTKDTARRWAGYFDEIADYLEAKEA